MQNNTKNTKITTIAKTTAVASLGGDTILGWHHPN